MKNAVGIKESKTLLRSVTVKTLDLYTNDVYMHVAWGWGGVGGGGGGAGNIFLKFTLKK